MQLRIPTIGFCHVLCRYQCEGFDKWVEGSLYSNYSQTVDKWSRCCSRFNFTDTYCSPGATPRRAPGKPFRLRSTSLHGVFFSLDYNLRKQKTITLLHLFQKMSPSNSLQACLLKSKRSIVLWMRGLRLHSGTKTFFLIN